MRSSASRKAQYSRKVTGKRAIAKSGDVELRARQGLGRVGIAARR